MRKFILIALYGLFSAVPGIAAPLDISVTQTQEFAPDLINEILKEAAHCAGMSESEIFIKYEEGEVQIEKVSGAYQVNIQREGGGGVLQILVEEGL